MENSENINQSAKQAKCTDTIWMVVYVVCWFVIVALSICWIYFRFPHPTINVTDLLGNTCGVGSNQRNPNLPLSGINMIDKPYKHYYDSDEPGHSISNCVKECPLRDLSTIDDLVRYFEEFQINYCQYDLNISRLARDTSETTYFDPTVSCPKLPVYRSIPILGRCIPTGKNAPIQQTKKLLASIRFWEVAQQMFNDLLDGQSIRNKRCFRYSSNAYVMIARNKINFNEAANSMVGDTLLVCVCNSIREKDDCGRFKEYSLAAIFNPEAVNEISMQERQVAHSSEA
ncbi:hypothetical protein AND_000614 [Anopheles darlingi]|uniref:Uncharacterized protein n=1 Tax=Anopheles darlingi TaxID=43151 RepID=W5JWU2_ANODA|nr:hypothetical protein AND_000614 [Anopheles darlingi]